LADIIIEDSFQKLGGEIMKHKEFTVKDVKFGDLIQVDGSWEEVLDIESRYGKIGFLTTQRRTVFFDKDESIRIAFIQKGPKVYELGDTFDDSEWVCVDEKRQMFAQVKGNAIHIGCIDQKTGEFFVKQSLDTDSSGYLFSK
jgi:hypothetical protein